MDVHAIQEKGKKKTATQQVSEEEDDDDDGKLEKRLWVLSKAL
jgi:hypothetical protein